MLLPGTFGNGWSKTTETFAPGAISSWAAAPVAMRAAAIVSSNATFFMVLSFNVREAIPRLK